VLYRRPPAKINHLAKKLPPQEFHAQRRQILIIVIRSFISMCEDSLAYCRGAPATRNLKDFSLALEMTAPSVKVKAN
jgi:hypothetical protein